MTNEVLWHNFCLTLDMPSQHTKKKDCIYPYNPKKKHKNFSGGYSPDRRSGQDRRKSQQPDFLSEGGVERRSWKERRYLWYMTM
jgi:hypothetical protein